MSTPVLLNDSEVIAETDTMLSALRACADLLQGTKFAEFAKKICSYFETKVTYKDAGSTRSRST